ncbi:MAG: sulfotransferase [Halioglobus sp.]|nr:sulfotransferase [Halioglobus sp.]
MPIHSRAGEPADSGDVWPTFIVIGAPKAGTTSVYHYLDQHPDIYMSPVKEPHYFSLTEEMLRNNTKSHMHGVTYTKEEYQNLFSEAAGQRALGEASTGYLLSSTAAESISLSIPDVKIIVMLRNPADRAFSGYLMKLRNSKETSSLKDAFVRGKSYVEASFYYENLLRYFDRFPIEQIGIFLFEEFSKDPVAVMRRIYEFVGVDALFRPETTQYNSAWIPKNMFLNSLRTFVLRSKRVRYLLNNTPVKRAFRKLTREDPPDFSASARIQLLDIYRRDIANVEGLTGLNLSHWLD